MRHVLLLSIVFIGGMSVELNSVPWSGGKANDATRSLGSSFDDKVLSSAEAKLAPGVQTDDVDFDGGIAAQVVSKGKADRLFAIHREMIGDVATLMPDALAPSETEAADAPLPQLTTGEFCEALADAAEKSAIPVAFFARLIWQESKFKHDATSHVGAQGVAQFMPRTAAEMGLDNPFDPRKALPASARYLRKLHDQFGNLGLAAAAYNGGSGRLQNWLARRGPLPDETRNYVRKITGNTAETWTSEKKTAALQQELPREAPCEGIGGLSRHKEVVAMAVELTPAASETIRKAEAEAAVALAAATKAKARLLLAKVLKGKGSKDKTATQVAAADKSLKKTIIIAVAKKATVIKVAALGRAKAKDAKADQRIKVASAAK